jgi:uncharacterized membrane protein YdjX (TVP38/TMEM64 family)
MTLRNRVLVVFALLYAIGAVLLVPGAPMTALSGMLFGPALDTGTVLVGATAGRSSRVVCALTIAFRCAGRDQVRWPSARAWANRSRRSSCCGFSARASPAAADFSHR